METPYFNRSILSQAIAFEDNQANDNDRENILDQVQGNEHVIDRNNALPIQNIVTTTYEYDALGVLRATGRNQQNGFRWDMMLHGQHERDDRLATYEYNAQGNVLSITYSQQDSVSNAFEYSPLLLQDDEGAIITINFDAEALRNYINRNHMLFFTEGPSDLQHGESNQNTNRQNHVG